MNNPTCMALFLVFFLFHFFEDQLSGHLYPVFITTFDVEVPQTSWDVANVYSPSVLS